MKRMTSRNICMLNWVTLGRFLFCVVVLWTQFVRAEVKVSLVEIETKLSEPFGIDFDQSGAMYVIEYGGHRLIRVKNGRVEVLAGNGEEGFGGDGGPAAGAQVKWGGGVGMGAGGGVYIGGCFNWRGEV